MNARLAALIRERLERNPADPYAHACPRCGAPAMDYCRWPGDVLRPGQWHPARVIAAGEYAMPVRGQR